MSVMVVPNNRLSQFAIFAFRQRLLPPSVSAADFAARLRSANLEWASVRDEHEIAPLDPGLIEAACRLDIDHDPMTLIRIGRDLLYNLEIRRGGLILAVINRVMARAILGIRRTVA
ncbi:hypothetical protein [Brevundimonas nasdae]|uniref:Uncharacterized protein n=1 Tax=Brevundimonas nasdae TaxID=172043 RepID=A0ABX8TLG7_9CAUL|nr:hypothetical protein [Brevundimonas nasdae]QYC11484.1 hypothetical protein KWG56_05775 [Brevundimonas nasdae]QYC14272.1 hypothetical protein KWG63_01110 [Brevundimonas nasdae]